jgi:hypothetical protein
MIRILSWCLWRHTGYFSGAHPIMELINCRKLFRTFVKKSSNMAGKYCFETKSHWYLGSKSSQIGRIVTQKELLIPRTNWFWQPGHSARDIFELWIRKNVVRPKLFYLGLNTLNPLIDEQLIQCDCHGELLPPAPLAWWNREEKGDVFFLNLSREV